MKIYTDTRDAAFAELFEIARKDTRVILLTADTGAFKFKDFQKHLPNQFFNVGISEQNAISVAAGLALSGKKVFVFGITPFVTLRTYEQIKVDICCMDLPVTILGMGTGYGYSYDGPTHHVTQDLALMRALPGMTIWGPSDPTLTGAVLHKAWESMTPCFIRIDKGPLRAIYDSHPIDWSSGMTVLREGSDVLLVATGPMTTQAFPVAEQLVKQGIRPGILDIFQLKPFPVAAFIQILQNVPRVVSLEEHVLAGGFGSLIAETFCDEGIPIPLKRIGIGDHYRLETGTREYVRSLDRLDVSGITETIVQWM